VDEGTISTHYLVMIVTGIILGTTARLLTIKADYRQYPSYPNGYLIHLVTGFVAASLGSVAIPALMTKNFVAVTFLTLAIQQFRDVRKSERESLKDLENTEFTYRGDAYIDGISKTFESRNYFALIIALISSITIQISHLDQTWINVLIAIMISALTFYIINRFSKGKSVGDIADVKEGKIEVKGSELFVDGIYVSNLLGTDNAANMYKEEGLAVVIYPHEEHFRIGLDNFGQRQAILFEATRALGAKRYNFSRKEYDEGRIVITLIPISGDINKLIHTVKNTPVLESVKKSSRLMQTNFIGRK